MASRNRNPKAAGKVRHLNVQKIVLRAMVVGSLALAQGMLPGALAKVIHVRMDGHDTSCNGTANAAASAAPNCAYSTLNKGYQSSSAGDTVAVHAGTYATWNGDTLRPDACAASGYQEMIGMTASTPSGTPGNPITIDMTVDGPSSVTIDGQGVRGRIFFFMKNVSYVTFKGGLFRNIVPLLP